MDPQRGGRHLLSIVTVHKDDPQGLVRTVESILKQKDVAYEHIVVDGSECNSLAVRSALDLCRGHGRVIWQPPQGVYKAMNAGLEIAKGEYVYFVNAGDVLADESVLMDLTHVLETFRPEWLFGLIELRLTNGKLRSDVAVDYWKASTKGFLSGKFPRQPATVARRMFIIQNGGFVSEYTIAADFHLMLKLASSSAPLSWSRVMCEFRMDGVSSRHWLESIRQAHRARSEVLQWSGTKSRFMFLANVPLISKALISRLARRV